jgi:hypothetical protein
MRTIRAAVDRAIGFDPMADDFALAVRARRCDCMDCAFEAVEDMCSASDVYFEAFIVVIPQTSHLAIFILALMIAVVERIRYKVMNAIAIRRAECMSFRCVI